MRWHAALLGLFVGTTTASCAFLLDFDELQKEDQPAPSVALKDVPAGFAAALCARYERCLGPMATLYFGDEDCVELLTLQLGDSIFAELGGLPESGFVYHPDRAQGCFDAVRNAKCDTSFAFPEACEAALEGRIDLGGPCSHPAECKRGLYCQVTGPCPGSCQPRPPAGQPCAQGTCLEGLYCDDKLGCVAPVGAGGECGGQTHPDCELGLFCLGNTKDKTGACQPVAEVFDGNSGNVCNWMQGPLCGEGLACQLDSTQEAQSGNFGGHCVEEIPAGKPCKLAIPDPCAANHYCKPSDQFTVEGTCTQLPGAGQECAKDAVISPQCRTKFRCVTKAGADGSVQETCEALVPLNTGCGENDACYSGNCSSGVCAPPNYCKL